MSPIIVDNHHASSGFDTRIAVLGAFDRMNYGDLMFPLILGKWLEVRKGISSSCLHYYGLAVSDLSRYGAYPTRPISELIADASQYTGLIVAGGEVLSASWVGLYNSIYGRPSNILRRLQRKVAAKFHSPFPFVLCPADFSPHLPVAYNAVGGSGLAHLPLHLKTRVACKLQKSAYVSFRDRITSVIINEVAQGLDSRVDPDCVMVASELFPLAQLSSLISHSVSHLGLDRANRTYLCFQAGKGNVGDQVQVVADQLDSLAQTDGLEIVLCPIGLAHGHEDDLVLREIHDTMKAQAVLIEEPTVYDIMFAIANSRIFAGTSLHGAITSMSYGVCHVTLSREQSGLRHKSKQQAFLDTWDEDEQKAIFSFNVMANTIRQRLSLILPQKLQSLRESLIAKADYGIDRMFNGIGLETLHRG